jgi:ribosome recycling factor
LGRLEEVVFAIIISKKEFITMVNDVIAEAKSKMKATLHVFNEELSAMRSGRASAAMVDRVVVEYYGVETELRQLATISTPEPMQILIRPFDKTIAKAIEKAVRESDYNMNPNLDGDVIRINLPPLTRERRQDLVKFLHKRMEEHRISVRNIRRTANDDLKELEKEKLISEDDMKRGESEVQKLTNEHIELIDHAGKAKEHDIMQV